MNTPNDRSRRRQKYEAWVKELWRIERKIAMKRVSQNKKEKLKYRREQLKRKVEEMHPALFWLPDKDE